MSLDLNGINAEQSNKFLKVYFNILKINKIFNLQSLQNSFVPDFSGLKLQRIDVKLHSTISCEY